MAPVFSFLKQKKHIASISIARKWYNVSQSQSGGVKASDLSLPLPPPALASWPGHLFEVNLSWPYSLAVKCWSEVLYWMASEPCPFSLPFRLSVSLLFLPATAFQQGLPLSLQKNLFQQKSCFKHKFIMRGKSDSVDKGSHSAQCLTLWALIRSS